MTRKWTVVLVIAVVSMTGVALVLKNPWSKDHAVAALIAATNDDERMTFADRLVDGGSSSAIVISLTNGTPEVRQAVIRSVANRAEDDPRYAGLTTVVHSAIDAMDGESVDAAMNLLSRMAVSDAELAKSLVLNSLTSGPVAREAACRIAIRPEINLTEPLVRLLNDEVASVRRAATLAIGPNRDAVGEERLFQLLSDSDEEVRNVSASVLTARGLDDRQIELGRKLLHPDPATRLALLVDLKFAGTAIQDVGPWLARLSNDPDPAVRAGTARLAFECRVNQADWLNDLADRDPDRIVRSVAGHYRSRSNELRATGGYNP